MLVEVCPKLRICFDIFQNIFELQSLEDKSLSRLWEYNCFDFLNSMISLFRRV